jgi:hypothetical protein
MYTCDGCGNEIGHPIEIEDTDDGGCEDNIYYCDSCIVLYGTLNRASRRL